jgi:hypothetical protein
LANDAEFMMNPVIMKKLNLIPLLNRRGDAWNLMAPRMRQDFETLFRYLPQQAFLSSLRHVSDHLRISYFVADPEGSFARGTPTIRFTRYQCRLAFPLKRSSCSLRDLRSSHARWSQLFGAIEADVRAIMARTKARS